MSEQKTAKVQAVLDIRPWDGGQNGTVYYHKLLMDNDDVGTIGKKKDNAFQIGDSLTYTTEVDPRGGFKFKEVKDNPFTGGKGGGSGKSYSDPRTMLCSYSKDIIVASMNNGFFDPASDPFQAVIDGADRLSQWYDGKSGMQTVEFSGPDTMQVAPDVRPYVEEQRTQQVQQAFAPKAGIREKPNKGSGGKPPSDAQRNLLRKLCGEKGVNLNQMITQEWDDVTDESELGSWPVSYLIDVLMHG